MSYPSLAISSQLLYQMFSIYKIIHYFKATGTTLFFLNAAFATFIALKWSIMMTVIKEYYSSFCCPSLFNIVQHGIGHTCWWFSCESRMGVLQPFLFSLTLYPLGAAMGAGTRWHSFVLVHLLCPRSVPICADRKWEIQLSVTILWHARYSFHSFLTSTWNRWMKSSITMDWGICP